ncbi:MAG: beta-ketoacyl-ACP synthase III [Clostridiales bacterium]
MDNGFSVGIIGLGMFVPDNVLTNKDLEKMVDTSNEWIIKRTGISERRVLEKGRPSSDMAYIAAKKALEDANILPEDVDLIIVATITPDYLTPSMACIVQDKLNAKKAAAFDLNAACTGFVYSMTVAEQFIKTGYYKNALIIGCDGLSKAVDWEDRNTCVLFGDGAGAAVLSAVEDGYGIRASKTGAEGGMGKLLTLPCYHFDEVDMEKRIHQNKRVIWMGGNEVFKFAVKVMEQSTIDVMNQAGLCMDDISLIIPHQANKRIIDGAAKRLKISNDRVIENLSRYGNTSAATIPIALYETYKANKIKNGDNIVLVGFGGGLTWAAVLIKWNKKDLEDKNE